MSKKVINLHKYLKTSGLDSLIIALLVLPTFYLFLYFVASLGLYLRSIGVI
jgi:hypothetical protein